MGKKLVWLIIISLVCSPLVSLGTLADPTEKQTSLQAGSLERSSSTDPQVASSDPEITIVSPEAGCLYLFKLQPIQMPLPSILGLNYAVVIGRSLAIDTTSSDVHHAKFVAKRVMTGWETVRWDYRTMDGLTMDLGLTSGLYTVTVRGYDETDNEVCSDSMKIFYLKVGREDFGVWVNTKYDGGETISTPLQLGISDFASMLNTGESKQFSVSMQHEDDTNVELRFIRTKIMNNTEKVVETKCNIETTCDTTKEYEVSVEMRFPFVMLEGGQPSEDNNPYFSTKIGFISTAGPSGANHVNTTFYVGRENINDPRVFRLSVKPDTIESGSKLTFFTNFLTVNSSGEEVFQRLYTIDFEPATELTITSIPREAKISYDFGRSAGVPTKISLKAEGGILDDIIQSYQVDPLPSYMNFDLSILGAREFLYESDRSYNVTYSLDSEQNGNLVVFKVDSLPEHIDASWGLELGTLGDLEASSFAELNMSQDVRQLSLSFFGNDRPFISLENFPRKLRFENAVDLLDGTGNITLIRGLDEVRTINVSIAYQDMVVTKSFDLKNNFVQMKWDIDLVNGTGLFDITRDSETTMMFSTTIQYHGWTFTKTLELRNNHLALSWNVNRQERRGEIILSRDAVGGSPTVTFSLAHDGWILADTLELNNEYLRVYWQLPTTENTHAELGCVITGGEMFHNTISFIDDGIELFHIGVGIQTDDHFILSWDYVNGQITNFEWSGRLLRLTDVDISANLNGEVFSIDAEFTIGQAGSVELQFNKPVAVTFVNTASESFKIYGDVSIYANRRLQVSWELGDTGEFSIYTFGQPLGDQFALEFGYDPQHTGNYQYGFRLSGEDFIEIARTIQWDVQDGQLDRIWILGDEPIPGDWTLELLWNGEWFTVPYDAS